MYGIQNKQNVFSTSKFWQGKVVVFWSLIISETSIKYQKSTFQVYNTNKSAIRHLCLINLWDINFCIREKWRFVSLLTKFRVNKFWIGAITFKDRYQKCMLKASCERYLNSFKITGKKLWRCISRTDQNFS